MTSVKIRMAFSVDLSAGYAKYVETERLLVVLVERGKCGTYYRQCF